MPCVFSLPPFRSCETSDKDWCKCPRRGEQVRNATWTSQTELPAVPSGMPKFALKARPFVLWPWGHVGRRKLLLWVILCVCPTLCLSSITKLRIDPRTRGFTINKTKAQLLEEEEDQSSDKYCPFDTYILKDTSHCDWSLIYWDSDPKRRGRTWMMDSVDSAAGPGSAREGFEWGWVTVMLMMMWIMIIMPVYLPPSIGSVLLPRRWR